MKQWDRRALLSDLHARARELEPPAPRPEPMEKIEIDTEKAAAWYAEQGVRVVSAG